VVNLFETKSFAVYLIAKHQSSIQAASKQ